MIICGTKRNEKFSLFQWPPPIDLKLILHMFQTPRGPFLVESQLVKFWRVWPPTASQWCTVTCASHRHAQPTAHMQAAAPETIWDIWDKLTGRLGQIWHFCNLWQLHPQNMLSQLHSGWPDSRRQALPPGLMSYAPTSLVWFFKIFVSFHSAFYQ